MLHVQLLLGGWVRYVGDCCRDGSICCARQVGGGVLNLGDKVTAHAYHVQG